MVFINLAQKDFMIFSNGYAANAGGGWTRDLTIADCTTLGRNVASEVHVKMMQVQRSWILQFCRKHTCCLAQVVPQDKKVPHNVTPYAIRESRASREECPQLGARRGMTLCSAQGINHCKKKAALQTFLKLIATLWKQAKFSGLRLKKFIHRHRAMPGEQIVCTEESHHSQLRQNCFDVVTHTNNNLEKKSIDEFLER